MAHTQYQAHAKHAQISQIVHKYIEFTCGQIEVTHKNKSICHHTDYSERSKIA